MAAAGKKLPHAGDDIEIQLGRQMGCMAGFFHILPGKRIYTPRRIPSASLAAGSTSPSERSEASAAASVDEWPVGASATPPPLDFKEVMKSSWRMREAPRLSLDSRAVLDAKGKLRHRAASGETDLQRRSPGVVAKLMGLEALPDADAKPQLRRSASETRLPREISRLLDPPPGAFQKPPPTAADERPESPRPRAIPAPVIGTRVDLSKRIRTPLPHRKGFFDARDFYIQRKEDSAGYSARGIDDPEREVNKLNQILEAMQLKGLLRSRPPHDLRRRGDSPIVVMKPHPNPKHTAASEPMRVRLKTSHKRTEINQNTRSGYYGRTRMPVSPARSRSPSPIAKSKPSSPVRPENNQTARQQQRSPRCRTFPSPPPTSPRNNPTSSPHLEPQRWRTEEYREGRRLLERCDKLLHSIAAITDSSITEQKTMPSPAMAAAAEQPSPVSVLDSSTFLCDESSPSSDTTKRSDFKDQLREWEDEEWNQALLAIRWRREETPNYNDPDFRYVADIVRATTDRGGAPPPQKLWHRRDYEWHLLHDLVGEIMERARDVTPWDAFTCRGSGRCKEGAQLVREVWREVRQSSAATAGEDMCEVTWGAIKKDMAGMEEGAAWRKTAREMSEAVLHIERQMFKDLVAETIRDLAEVTSGRWRGGIPPRRKLAF